MIPTAESLIDSPTGWPARSWLAPFWARAMRMAARVSVHVPVLSSYAAVAAAFSWPLVLHLNEALLGPVGGDTGVYVWNLWLFRHEILTHGRFPLFTQDILALTPPVDLSLHNYTLFANLLAFPLLSFLGVVATFNIIYLTMSVVTAWSMFMLARALVKRTAVAWLAGLLFGFSPVLLARGEHHFSLAMAAPLPIFLLVLHHAALNRYRKYATALGAVTAWATMCDPYYGVFCVVLASAYVITRATRPQRRLPKRSARQRRALTIIDTCLALTGLVVMLVTLTDGIDVIVLTQRVAVRSLYTPILILTALVLYRIHLKRTVRYSWRLAYPGQLLRFAAVAGAMCGVLLLPVLTAYAYALSDGAVLHGRTFWRSSPAGVDLLALFAPNPNHPLLGYLWRDWLTSRPNGYTDNVASLTVTAIAVFAIAVWRFRFRPPRTWVVLAALCAALALGPFVHMGGSNTFVPGPWALLRYVPIVTATRMPGRYAIPAMMMVTLLFAGALRRVVDQQPSRRAAVLVSVTALLLFELCPYPRPLFSAHVPAVYGTIASDPRDLRVLELPLGIRDGEWSLGDFSAASQFYQTHHQKPIIGGYLSRISEHEVQRQRRSLTVRSLIQLSEGRPVSPHDLDEVRRRAPGFVKRAELGYVVIDTHRTPAALREFAVAAYGLVKLVEADGQELYAPTIRFSATLPSANDGLP